MKLTSNQDRPGKESAVISKRKKSSWGLVMASIAALSVAAYSGPQQVQRDPAWKATSQGANGTPDPNDLVRMRGEQARQESFDAANAARKREIADDSAKLLKLAADLKAEVDKTNKDTLSLAVIRKADEIEKLAHDVKERMKTTAGGG